MKKNLKKALIVTAVVTAMICSLTACGSSDKDTTSASQSESSTPESTDGFKFTYNGKTITLNEDMSTVLADIGKESQYFESDSCAFQGKDKVYTYNSFVIKTYPDGDKDYVLSISLKDDLVSTEEGVSVGSSMDDVTSKYSDGNVTSASAVYTKGDTTLTFIVENDKVSSIEYRLVK